MNCSKARVGECVTILVGYNSSLKTSPGLGLKVRLVTSLWDAHAQPGRGWGFVQVWV